MRLRVRYHPSHGRRATFLTAAVGLALAACAPGGPTPTAPTAPPPSSGAASAAPLPPGPSPSTSSPASPSAGTTARLLLEVRQAGGFINPAATIGSMPTVVVDADGRVYTPRPVTGSGHPLIPAMDVRDTGSAGASEVLAAAKAAGLDTASSSGIPGDAGSTVFTLVVNGSNVVTKVSTLGAGGPGAPGSSAGGSAAPGAEPLALLARLTDPAKPWPASPSPASPFTPSAYWVWVAPEAAGGVGSATTPWPLAADPNTFGDPASPDHGVPGLRSGLVRGSDATALAKALGGLTAGSDVISGGHAYRVWVRPALPDELGG